MDARSSHYHDVYARWQRDPEGFWGEAANDIDWIEQPKKVFDKSQGIYGRWFTGGVVNTCYNALDRHCLSGRNDQAALIYDSPVTNTKQTFTYGRLLSEVQLLGAMLRDFGVKKGDVVILYMPMMPGGGIRHAGLRAHRRHPLGGVRRLRAQGARHPHRRLQAEGHPLGQLRHRGQSCGAVQAAARRGHQPRQAQAADLPDPAAPAMRKRHWSKAATTTGAKCGSTRSNTPRPPNACRSPPPIRSTFSTPPARPASRKAWCATMAAIWSRSNGRCNISTASIRARSGGAPPTSAGWSATPTSSMRRSSTARPP